MQKSMVPCLAAGLVLTVGFGRTASAIDFHIDNAGFEAFALQDGEFTRNAGFPCNPPNPLCINTNDDVPGWALSQDVGTSNPTTSVFPGEAPEGQNVAFGNGSPAMLSQVLGATLFPDVTYTLKVEVGDGAGFAFPGYSVELWAGGTRLGFENGLAPADGTFATSLVAFTASSTDPNLGQQFEIRLISVNQGTFFDDVRLSTPSVVPALGGRETVLLCAALVGTAALLRRVFDETRNEVVLLGVTTQTCRGPRAPRPRLRLVHRRLRHRRPEGREGAARGAVIGPSVQNI
jgi:hypothetical protein